MSRRRHGLLHHLKVMLLILAVCNVVAPGSTYRQSFINPYPRFSEYVDDGNPGEALILTPLIHNESVPRQQIREMAKVEDSVFLGVESYAGYLTVDPKFNSNMFFWYFPSEVDSHYRPVVLWLQGGPGASSLFGLFAENGPFQLTSKGILEKREYRWSRTNNLIYIDNPVGTGFSFTDQDEGYARNEKDVGHNLHEAIYQLYQLFEWSNTGDFWITGESYAGKYIPALAYHIHAKQRSITSAINIPLKGLAIGNGLSDPLHQLDYGNYLYQLGLIDRHGLQVFNNAQMKAQMYIKNHEMKKAFDVFDSLLNGDVHNGSTFHNLTGFNYYYNFLKTDDREKIAGNMGEFLQQSYIRRAIHVGNKTFHDLDTQNKVEEHLKADVMMTIAPWISELLDYYTVCIYNGQLDIIVAYPLTRNYLERLKFTGSDIYKTAERSVWMVDDDIAGYIKKAGNLIEVMVRNAGHMAPLDQPKWMYALIEGLTNKTIAPNHEYYNDEL